MDNTPISIAISKLRIGMYVIAFNQVNSELKMVKPGHVRTEGAIERLRQMGIKELVIDPSFDLNKEDEQPKVQAVKAPLAKIPRISSMAEELERVTPLMRESKILVNKILEDARQGRPIDIDGLEHLADKMIDSVVRNPDALQCMAAIRSKDTYLLEHSINVSVFLARFALAIKLDRATVKKLAMGGLLHDIGKIKIRDEVLHKPAKLTDSEFTEMKQHPRISFSLLVGSGKLDQITIDIATGHHEKLDGSGYPDGLKGEQLSQPIRMAAIVDIYDALTATRCYKKAMSPNKAFKILLEQAPDKLDQHLLHQFIHCIGIYPVGTMVELSNGKVGIVWQSNAHEDKAGSSPVVKCFYDIKHKHYTQVNYVDIRKENLTIAKSLAPDPWGIDSSNFRE